MPYLVALPTCAVYSFAHLGSIRVLERLHHYRKPVIVTENGIADADDNQRGRYLVAHLRQAHRAAREGVDLRGYIHWSLLDNVEWSE